MSVALHGALMGWLNSGRDVLASMTPHYSDPEDYPEELVSQARRSRLGYCSECRHPYGGHRPGCPEDDEGEPRDRS